ncbi:hypothetical protein Pcinc_005093 [Petrolisthes cinctipes]|uniref:Uncharacterized protein n=1 Tax=Petrolisthes cinctipes TaxID=88211 RepID=A0AAE1GFP2_PETCI|nr:hypothetical protein Pcinc_005093 [Petrolisthes cinctipes]
MEEDTDTSSCSTSTTTKDNTTDATAAPSLPESTHEPPVAVTTVQYSTTTISTVPTQLSQTTIKDSLASVEVEGMDTEHDTTTDLSFEIRLLAFV